MIDFDSLTLGEVKRIRELFGAPTQQTDCCDPVVGKYCVVRTYSAGVHVGTVKTRTGTECVLTDAKRIWNWYGANTLHEVATKGIESRSRVSDPVESILLTQAVEFIPCSDAAAKILKGAKWEK